MICNRNGKSGSEKIEWKMWTKKTVNIKARQVPTGEFLIWP